MKPDERIRRLALELGVELASGQLQRLTTFTSWLENEAIPAGGIGPNEAGILLDRHVLDALTFLAPIGATTPRSVLDIGSGVGLPGIPLAVALPTTRVRLVDRSGRRCALMSRAVRVLELDNVDIERVDVAAVREGAEIVVSRASLHPGELLPHLRRLTQTIAIVAGSAVSAVEVTGFDATEIESRYLDSPRWLLIMHPS